MGRANRTQTLPNCHYEVHISFNCLLSAFVRVMTTTDKKERRLQLSLHEVVSFFVLPNKCYHHTLLEKHFERIAEPKQPCNTNCSVCLGETSQFTGPVRRSPITSVLCSALQMHNSAATPDSLKAESSYYKTEEGHLCRQYFMCWPNSCINAPAIRKSDYQIPHLRQQSHWN